MKRHDREHEDCKERNLDKQSGNNDIFTNLQRLQRPSCLDASTTRLEKESRDVAEDEDARDPLEWNGREGFGGNVAVMGHEDDETAESHVD